MAKNKINRTVVRNAAYTAGEFNLRERHNERKNESYHNGDIDVSRKDMNIHFHRNLVPDGTPETYEQTFKRLMDDGTIVQRGQAKDGSALVFDEMVFDVNTAYFEENGGYEYAKSFFEEAYRCALKEIGGEFGAEHGEKLVLSAVLHADERNKALSEELGRDVYHYHLHVIYVPVVPKEIKWSKRTKDKSLIGKVKEVIPQISHWKKWPQRVPVERDGKTIILNSYSLLQDRFFEHMKSAGFEGFERGERGSNREHLSDLDYKIQQDKKRLADITAQIQEQEETSAVLSSVVEEKQQTAAVLDSTIQKKEQAVTTLDTAINDKKKSAATLDKEAEAKKKTLAKLKEKTATAKHEFATASDVEKLGEKRSILGAVQMSQKDWEFVSDLAKEGIKAKRVERDYVDYYSSANEKLQRENERLSRKLDGYEGKGLTDSMEYYKARQRAPKRLAETVADILRKPPENQRQQERSQQHNQQQKKSTKGER